MHELLICYFRMEKGVKTRKIKDGAKRLRTDSRGNQSLMPQQQSKRAKVDYPADRPLTGVEKDNLIAKLKGRCDKLRGGCIKAHFITDVDQNIRRSEMDTFIGRCFDAAVLNKSEKEKGPFLNEEIRKCIVDRKSNEYQWRVSVDSSVQLYKLAFAALYHTTVYNVKDIASRMKHSMNMRVPAVKPSSFTDHTLHPITFLQTEELFEKNVKGFHPINGDLYLRSFDDGYVE